MRAYVAVLAAAVFYALNPWTAAQADDADITALIESADPALQVDWALRYVHAEGVIRDYERAIRLFCAAARQGSAEAQYELGWLYANGRGRPRDDVQAAAWFRLAAAQGDVHATRMLAWIGDADREEPARCILPNGEEVLESKAAATRRWVTRTVRQRAPEFGLDPKLVLALIEVESSFDPEARSPKNAQGLMQLIPATAARFGVKDIMHPLENLDGGMAYLKWLLDHFDGNLELALAGYNAGESAVKRYGGIPPHSETRRYVKSVLALYGRHTQARALNSNRRG
ncbi:MAG: transglycosylase SLT domain-containing protein [Gammaproteobacteria bacterium]|nr:transglycosylase SLT domain-containing protein [Gammaproteobacteria bacterium]